jgi:hypothetical protein
MTPIRPARVPQRVTNDGIVDGISWRPISRIGQYQCTARRVRGIPDQSNRIHGIYGEASRRVRTQNGPEWLQPPEAVPTERGESR